MINLATSVKVIEYSEMEVLILLIGILALNYSVSEAQVVSHELRRLAIATNQFGIDAIKALDRIEPPDKVLVFCPACLSSSLMMIMMGSSKYQVVSALRHALYVWSMKPQEINKGFKDIFEHIGLNQYQQSHKLSQSQTIPAMRRSFHKRSVINYNSTYTTAEAPLKPRSKFKSLIEFKKELIDSSPPMSIYLSLPKLIRLKEFLDKSDEPDLINWWQTSDNSHTNDSRVLKEALPSTVSVRTSPMFKLKTEHISNSLDHGINQRGTSDFSQMSAISNIYIQRGLAMNYNYNLLLRHYYKTVIHPVDFLRNSEETRQHINSLVASNTEGKIKDLVGPQLFGTTSSPKIMLISTFHFRGILDIQLKPQDNATAQSEQPRTTTGNFINQTYHHSPHMGRRQFFIETEETLLKHGQFSEPGCSVIEVPFNNRLISLIIVMPTHQNLTESLLTKLSAQVLSDMISSLVVKKISLEIPVIKFDRGPINVDGMLKELGLSNLFFGDKIYTSETGLNKWLRASDIIHETSIDIGTLNPKWGQPEDRLKVGAHNDRSSDVKMKIGKTEKNHIKLDKPFFYFVLDSLNGLVLTMGRIRQ